MSDPCLTWQFRKQHKYNLNASNGLKSLRQFRLSGHQDFIRSPHPCNLNWVTLLSDWQPLLARYLSLLIWPFSWTGLIRYRPHAASPAKLALCQVSITVSTRADRRARKAQKQTRARNINQTKFTGLHSNTHLTIRCVMDDNPPSNLGSCELRSGREPSGGERIQPRPA